MCSLCIEACPTDAIEWSQDFRHATFDRTELTKILNKPDSLVKKGIED